MSFSLPELPGSLPIVGDPPLSHRFLVQFLMNDGPNLTDMLFSKVRGLGFRLERNQSDSSSQRRYEPEYVRYSPLVLERGLTIVSPLVDKLNTMVSTFKFERFDIVIVMFSAEYAPLKSWQFYRALPIEWTLTPLDAQSNMVSIETITFTYQHMKPLGI